jgi:hypothetical protein
MKKLLQWIGKQIAYGSMRASGRAGDWMGDKPTSATFTPASGSSSGGTVEPGKTYRPDEDFESIDSTPVMNPIIQFTEAVKDVKVADDNPFKGAKVSEAWLFEGKFDERGKLLESSVPDVPGYRITHVKGHDQFKEAINTSELKVAQIPVVASKMIEAKRAHLERIEKLKEAGLIKEDSFGQDLGSLTQYDPNQYTEYTPTYGGPFFKQLYLTDYLMMHSRAFEQWNHHPLAKRIISLFGQYAFGRRFQWRIKDKKKEKAWEDFDKKHNLRHRVSKFWVPEYILFGEHFIDKKTWQSIDPSTIWDIITDPDDITDVYYYHQQYSTAYQQFTGSQVKGVAGSANVKAQDFIIRQLPFKQIIHIRRNCTSFEKRGRSILFPILGWLKRIKDLYDAQVVAAWLSACFIWDDEIDGNAADIQAHIAKYNTMPTTGSVFAHNKMIKRQPMAAAQGAAKAGDSVGDELLAFIATAVGIPKDFFNIMGGGGGSRATALVGAEPFTKVIEEIQADIEYLLLDIAAEVIPDYKDGDVEFIFPSVTKDSTTETAKNIMAGEAAGYMAKETAAQMFAAEMNMTTYDWDDEKGKMDDEANAAMIDPAGALANAGPAQYDVPGAPGMPGSPGSNGAAAASKTLPETPISKQSPIHGEGKQRLKSQMGNL